MKARFLAGLGLLLPCISQAQVLYGSGFEFPSYAVGIGLNTQDGWTSSTAFDVATSPVFSGSQAVKFDLGGNTTGAFHASHSFAAVASGSVLADIKMFLPAGDPPNSVYGINFTSGGMVFGGVGVSPGGTVYSGGTSSEFDFGVSPLGNISNPQGRWIDLQIAATIGASEIAVLVDGQSFVNARASNASSIDGINLSTTRLAIETAHADASYDNLSVSAVPEPMSLLALSSGFVLLARRKLGESSGGAKKKSRD